MRKTLASLAAVIVLAGGIGATPAVGAQPDGVPSFMCKMFPFLC